jgi:hypothetical protein
MASQLLKASQGCTLRESSHNTDGRSGYRLTVRSQRAFKTAKNSRVVAHGLYHLCTSLCFFQPLSTHSHHC